MTEPTKRHPSGFAPFPTPPIDFDPRLASQFELARFGFPHRPDPTKAPDLHRRWMSAFSRPLRRVEPRFAVGPKRRHRPAAARARKAPIGGTAGPDDSNWAGFEDAGDGFVQSVWGSWTVPSVYTPPGLPEGASLGVSE